MGPTTQIATGILQPPDYLIIGAQKAGTTWLWSLFRDHPQIRIPPKKEIHFFDREIFSKSVEWYMREIAALDGSTVVRGEKTPCYAHLKPHSIHFIRQIAPQVKVILLLRKPTDRAWSQARMEVSNYNSRTLTTRDVIKCVFNTGIIRNTRRTDYPTIITRWRSVFPESQVFIGFYDDIETRPMHLFARICDFLGVNPPQGSAQGASTKVWKSPEMNLPGAVEWYLRRRYRRTSQWVADHFPEAKEWAGNGEVLRDSGTFLEKIFVLFVAYIATIPYNATYLLWDFFRDIRMRKRIRSIVGP